MDSLANGIRWTVCFVSDPSAILKLNCGISGDCLKRVYKFKVLHIALHSEMKILKLLFEASMTVTFSD
jgi:hypothetical protein